MKEFDREKFKAIVHYICHKADKNELGATKLNKILWYTDTIQFLASGKSVTGETYVKQDYGPVPHHILQIMDELEVCDFIKREKSPYYNYKKTDYNCLKKPDVSSIEKKELGLIDIFIDVICKEHTAISISTSTHDWIWEIADQGEEIPLYTAFVANIKKPSEAARNWAMTALDKR